MNGSVTIPPCFLAGTSKNVLFRILPAVLNLALSRPIHFSVIGDWPYGIQSGGGAANEQ